LSRFAVIEFAIDKSRYQWPKIAGESVLLVETIRCLIHFPDLETILPA